jgi:hypothetical protein
MSYKSFKSLKLVFLMLAAVALMAGPSFALTKNLAVVEAEWLPPGGTLGTDEIPMWAFVDDPVTCPTTPVPWNVGPKIVVPTAEGLTINLRNCLSEPVSVVIPGQSMPATGTFPVWTDGSAGARTSASQRVRSFTAEAAPAGGTQSYTWGSFKAGTYLYHSGTHPQVQVQMGLYGAAGKLFSAGNAYDGVAFNSERDLLFSEIEPVLHAAVDDGSYGTTGPTSTLDYDPKYFLINGEAFEVGDACIDTGLNAGDSILLRMMNAGLRELGPMILGARWDVVAEGGNKYPFAKDQYSVLLPAMGTKDVIFTPNRTGDFPIIERRTNLTNPDPTSAGATTVGGMQTCLAVTGGNSTPVVAISSPPDGATFTPGTSITFTGTAIDVEDGDISADLVWTSSIDGTISPAVGSASFSATLSLGIHTITASVTDSSGASGSASIIVNSNTAPVVTITAPPDPTTIDEGVSITFTGTAIDAGEDGDISASLSWSSSIDGHIGDTASVTTSSLSGGTHTITASVTDSLGGSDSDTVSVTVTPGNTAPVVTITNPSTGATFTQVDSIPFSGTATDAEESGISGADLNWTSSLNGGPPSNIGTGASFSTTLLVGTHSIVASVTDTGVPPLEGSDSITVHIIEANPDTLTCKKADYKAQNDRLTIEVVSDDLPKGNRIITGVVDGGDPFIIPVKNPGSDVYRIVIQPFPNPDPGPSSVFTATSDLGGMCTIPVN